MQRSPSLLLALASVVTLVGGCPAEVLPLPLPSEACTRSPTLSMPEPDRAPAFTALWTWPKHCGVPASKALVVPAKLTAAMAETAPATMIFFM